MRVAPAPAAKKKNAPPHPQQKKKRAPAPTAKKKTRPPLFLPTPQVICFAISSPTPSPNAPPPLNCASVFKALNPSQGHHVSIVFANGGGRAAPRPTPPLFKTVPGRFSVSKPIMPALGLQMGGGAAPPPNPPAS